jgi:hypothetical protein
MRRGPRFGPAQPLGGLDMPSAAGALCCAAVCSTLGLATALPTDVAASPHDPCAGGRAVFRCPSPGQIAPPLSLRDFLALVGVLRVPVLAPVLGAARARCATPEAAAESGDCPPPATGAGGGHHPMMMLG